MHSGLRATFIRGRRFGLGRVVRSWLTAVALIAIPLSASDVGATSRIKDIADFEGIRDNMLIGYGLVVGLNGTGDSLRNAPFTKQSLESMLERLGVNTRDARANTKNVAAVMVTADLHPFARQGSRIDVAISTLGDAKDLLGGTLLVTPLIGADGEVYAVAQGSVAVSGFAAGGDAETVTRGVPTSGRIANGAIIEREVGFELAGRTSARIALRNPDLTTAKRMAQAINAHFGRVIAQSLDPATVALQIPQNGNLRLVDLLAEVEQIKVNPDQIARVVIDEHAGIIVMGADVRVDEVAIAQGNLTVRITETPQVSQPGPFAEVGETVVVPRTTVEITDDNEKRLIVLKRGVNLQTLVDGINALGVGPRDLISILQTVKAAGALQAEIVVQ